MSPRVGGVAVIGAGVVGLAAAAALQRRGLAVTLFDPEPPGTGASFGNAALFATGQCLPLGWPGIWRDIPGMLRDPLGPIAIRWPHLPALAPWLWRFLRASRAGPAAAAAGTLAALLGRALEDWGWLLGSAGGALLRRDGLLYVYQTAEGWQAAARDAELRRRFGIRVDLLGAETLPQLEPALRRGLAGGVFYPDAGHTTDPLALSTLLAARIAADGGHLRRDAVLDLAEQEDGVLLVTAGSRERYDSVVIAAGIHSAGLAARLGLRLPLDSERGYHLMLPEPGLALRRPIGSGERRFVMTPLQGGLRLAGTVEFGGTRRPPDWRRAAMLQALAAQLLPGLRAEGASRWMGHRPSTPDSLPLLGRVPGRRRIFLDTGHGHLGLTLAATSGRLLAEAVAAGTADPLLAPLDPGRFATR